MLAEGLEIFWEYGKEFVQLDPLNVTHETSICGTFETWRTEGKVVTYVTTSTIARNGDSFELHLRYCKDAQTDESVMSEVTTWGTSVIRWREKEREGTAEWVDDVPRKRNPVAPVKVLYRDRTGKRKRQLLSRVARPNQDPLRTCLLSLDRRCVVSGEQQAEVLQAAHIIAVKKGGDELVDNAILLRSDLHLLLDCDLLRFDVKADSAIVVIDASGSPSYKELEGKVLPDSTFRRVKRALLEAHGEVTEVD